MTWIKNTSGFAVRPQRGKGIKQDYRQGNKKARRTMFINKETRSLTKFSSSLSSHRFLINTDLLAREPKTKSTCISCTQSNKQHAPSSYHDARRRRPNWSDAKGGFKWRTQRPLYLSQTMLLAAGHWDASVSGEHNKVRPGQHTCSTVW